MHRSVGGGHVPGPVDLVGALEPGRGRLLVGDNLPLLRRLPAASFELIYIDPPFNTGRVQTRAVQRARRPAPGPDGAPEDAVEGFRGAACERAPARELAFADSFDDYWAFLGPRMGEARRLLTPTGTLYVHLDYREAHYVKVALDRLFGRRCFVNEIIWAYDYGGKTRRRWPTKHQTILVYERQPGRHYFDADAADREPYMAPGLVSPEKARRGKLPTDVWWHTIVGTTSAEKTGYPTQKPEGVLRRIVGASSRPGDAVLDFFAGSGTTGAVAAALGRRFVLIDDSSEAERIIRNRLGSALVG